MDRNGGARMTDRPGISVQALGEALEAECRLLVELAAALRGQRAGVVDQDAQLVDDSLFATHRVLRTLEQARTRRRTIVNALVGQPNIPVSELEQALGARVTDELRQAREELEAAAAQLAREISLNQEALRHALVGTASADADDSSDQPPRRVQSAIAPH